MLPNLIDLIIIFASWAMGIIQQFLLPSLVEGFFIVFLELWWALPFTYFLSSLNILEIFIVFEHVICSIFDIWADIS